MGTGVNASQDLSMIVALLSDPYLRTAVRYAARPDEDVVFDPVLARSALQWGFPRMVIREGGQAQPISGIRPHLPVLLLDEAMMRGWELDRLGGDVPAPRLEYVTQRLRGIIDQHEYGVSWVDRTLADLGKAAGTPLAGPLRGFARRILEFPTHYHDLHAMARACQLSRGALKARFRRRGLESPYTYLRWFRMMAVAYLLADREVTVAQAAYRLGFTSDGNLCRAMASLTGFTPTEVRTVRGWDRLLIAFSWTYLTGPSLDAWKGLDELFQRRAA
jgi:AraC-like DNA-binding protein